MLCFKVRNPLAGSSEVNPLAFKVQNPLAGTHEVTLLSFKVQNPLTGSSEVILVHNCTNWQPTLATYVLQVE